MDKEVNQHLLSDEDVGYAEDTQKIDLSILDCEIQVNKYLNSLLNNSETFYVSIHTKIIDKILMVDTEQVYQYHSNIDCFELTDLPVNSEEDYLILRLVDMTENNIPIFTVGTTMVELTTFDYFLTHFIKIPFYKWIFKRGSNAC